MEILITSLFWFLQIYYYIMIAYILMSWIPELRNSSFYRILHQLTDPYLGLLRGRFIIGNFDFSTLILLIGYSYGLSILRSLVASL